MARMVTPETKTLVFYHGPFDGARFEAPLAPTEITLDFRPIGSNPTGEHMARYAFEENEGGVYRYQFLAEDV